MSNNRLSEIMDFNKTFVEQENFKSLVTSKIPDKKIVILSCMDTRLTELLPKALNLKNGDAKIIKNAGATIMHQFGSIARSIIVAIYEFNVESVLIIGHYGCGMCKLNSESVLMKAVDRGIDINTLDMLRNSGININKWLEGFESEKIAVLESVESLKKHPLMPKDINIHGLMIDPETGQLDLLI